MQSSNSYIFRAFIRKISKLYCKILKAKKYWIDGDINTIAPLLINSLPKSGTHLLLQIVEPFPKLTNYGFFIASVPSRPHIVRDEESHKKLISKIIPGELVTSHLFYSEQKAQRLSEKNAIQFFIYRDLRDVVVSEALYLTYMNKWHHLHSYFANRLKSDNDRIKAAITGVDSQKFYYPNIQTRWDNYSGWINDDQVFSVKYEDLMSEGKDEIIRKMINFYKLKSRIEFDENELLIECHKSINPDKSHTFRKGGSGNWKKHFSEEHIDLLKDVAGDILIDLGYEDSLDW